MPKLSRAALCTLAALTSTALSAPVQAAEFAAAIDLSSIDSTTGVRLDGVATDDRSGLSVAGAGDVNGDGFADVIIGARGADPNGSFSGSSYVVFGKAAGFAGGVVNFSALNGSNGFRLDGVAADDLSGRWVAGAGDINGDGFSDLIVGAYNADPHGSNSGSTYVVFGKATFASSIQLSNLNGANGFRLDGVTNGDWSGLPAAAAGDINRDGYADVIVGAKNADPGGVATGASYVVFGKAAGFASSINLSTLNGSNGFRLKGAAVGDQSGQSVAGAGDVNGDGFPDLIVSSGRADPNVLDGAGSSYVVFGKASGFAASINLSALNGTTGFRLDGVATGDASG
ncbi:MAG TPA: integrin alpha, partial [Aestuariivirga sp.]|nr:integrin alpha [Aestuariivirga sp.]